MKFSKGFYTLVEECERQEAKAASERAIKLDLIFSEAEAEENELLVSAEEA